MSEARAVPPVAPPAFLHSDPCSAGTVPHEGVMGIAHGREVCR